MAAQGQNYNPPTCLAQPTTCLVKGSHLGLQLQRATTASLGTREKRKERSQSFRLGKFHLRHRRHRRHRLRGSPWYRFRYYGELRPKFPQIFLFSLKLHHRLTAGHADRATHASQIACQPHSSSKGAHTFATVATVYGGFRG